MRRRSSTGITQAPPGVEEREQRELPPRGAARKIGDKGASAREGRPAPPGHEGRRGRLARRAPSR